MTLSISRVRSLWWPTSRRWPSCAPPRLRTLVYRAGAEYRDLLTALADRVNGGTMMSACPQGRATSRHVILFLAANPSDTTRLALDEECAAIERELRLTTGRDDFDFRSRWAVSVDEVMRGLNELQPTVIHFTGHGGSTGRDERQPSPDHRDIGVVAAAGIQLQDEQRQPQPVSACDLTRMIGSAAPSARLVVLNACFSDAVADALRGVVDCVIGIRGAIGDAAARSFAVGFYRALGHRRSVSNAVEQAVATLAAKRQHASVVIRVRGQ